ncbi:hypothetical protein C1I72_03095 [Ehrlichia canis]|uniref:hypothetical protein n=1 Tax=Ehrlichia canis TaxID=944 RepID=UPI000C844E33|nr:hypothetical protein [Ehrlichia canis]AUO54852.1 hypothetical protein C1I72_03095 [Ehrlichia canis]
MNKSQSLYLFLFLLCVTILAFTAAILAFRFNDRLKIPYLNIIAAVVMSVLAVALLISVAHLVMHYQGTSVSVKDMPPRIAAGDQMVLFVPFTADQLSKLSPKNNIIDVKYDVVESGSSLAGKREFVLDITQSYGLCPTKKVQVVMDNNRQCQLLFTNEEISSQVNGPGMCFVVNGNTSIVKGNMQKPGFYIKHPEVKDGTLSLNCEYQKICTGSMEDLRYILRSECVRSGRTIYEMLLSNILTMCPNQKDKVIPSDASVTHSKDLWINTNSGRLALSLMKILSPDSTLINLEELKNDDEPLYQKITWIRNYLVTNGHNVSEASFEVIFKKASDIFYRRTAGMSEYGNLHSDRITLSGKKFSDILAEGMQLDEELLIIMAIASYSCEGTLDPYNTTNKFLREILMLDQQRSDSILKEIEEILGKHWYEIIYLNDLKFSGSKVCTQMKKLLQDGCDSATALEIVNAARAYMLEKQWSSVPITRGVGCIMNLGYLDRIRLCGNREVSVETQEEGVSSSIVEVVDTNSVQNLIAPGNMQ